MRYEWMLYYTILSVMILTFFIFSLIGTCMLLLVCQEVIVYLLYVIRSHRIILILRISAYLCCAYVQVLAGSIWSTQGAPMRNRSRNNHKAQDWAMATSIFWHEQLGGARYEKMKHKRKHTIWRGNNSMKKVWGLDLFILGPIRSNNKNMAQSGALSHVSPPCFYNDLCRNTKT